MLCCEQRLRESCPEWSSESALWTLQGHAGPTHFDIIIHQPGLLQPTGLTPERNVLVFILDIERPQAGSIGECPWEHFHALHVETRTSLNCMATPSYQKQALSNMVLYETTITDG